MIRKRSKMSGEELRALSPRPAQMVGDFLEGFAPAGTQPHQGLDTPNADCQLRRGPSVEDQKGPSAAPALDPSPLHEGAASGAAEAGMRISKLVVDHGRAHIQFAARVWYTERFSTPSLDAKMRQLTTRPPSSAVAGTGKRMQRERSRSPPRDFAERLPVEHPTGGRRANTKAPPRGRFHQNDVRLGRAFYAELPAQLRSCVDKVAASCQRDWAGRVAPEACKNSSDVFSLQPTRDIEGACVALLPTDGQGRRACFAAQDLLRFWRKRRRFDFGPAIFVDVWHPTSPVDGDLACRSVAAPAKSAQLDPRERSFQDRYQQYVLAGREQLLVALRAQRGVPQALFKAIVLHVDIVRLLRRLLLEKNPPEALRQLWGTRELLDVFGGQARPPVSLTTEEATALRARAGALPTELHDIFELTLSAILAGA